MKFYTLHISHRHGDNISVHTSMADARFELAAYSRQWWDREGVPGVTPVEDEDAIAAYWDHVEDESANIEEHEVAADSEIVSAVKDALQYEASQFDGPADEDLHVSGADLVDWFTQWRLEARAALAKMGVTA